MSVPKIIHQVWEGRMPTRLRIFARTWQEMNPEWEYYLWTRDEMDELVSVHFPEYEEMYRNFPQNVQRWDTIRYMILYLYGGIYADMDIECLRPIDPLMENVVMGFGEEPPQHNFHHLPEMVCNALMVSEAKCEGWLAVLKEVSEAVQRDYPYPAVFQTTGPMMLSRIFPLLKERYQAVYFPHAQVAPVSKNEMYGYVYHGKRKEFLDKIQDAYCVHYFLGEWDNNYSLYRK